MNNVIEIKHLWFSYGKVAVLEDINLFVEENTFLGIIGPNGGGKTTLVKIITGLLRPDRGTVTIFGRPPREAGDQIGYVPQHSFSDITFPITAFEVVLMGRLSNNKLLHNYTPEDRRAAQAALESVEMEDYRNRQIGRLSGGQRQRVLLARALVSNPKLLVLDEPISGIDTLHEFEFYEVLKRLKEKMTIILVSHDVGVVSQHVERIACLNTKMVYHDDIGKGLKGIEKIYGCPVDIIAHGIPHRVLRQHQNDRDA